LWVVGSKKGLGVTHASFMGPLGPKWVVGGHVRKVSSSLCAFAKKGVVCKFILLYGVCCGFDAMLEYLDC
jgi:hypothetical protein